MTTSSAKSRAVILALLVAVCLTTALWISYERAMTVRPLVQLAPEESEIRQSKGQGRDELPARSQVKQRAVQAERNRRTMMGSTEDFSDDTQPVFQSQSHYSNVGLSLAQVTPPNANSIALIDLREITIAYQKQNGYLPTNTVTEWKNYIQSIQLIVSNRAVAEGYTLVLSKTALNANAMPIYYFTGDIPDITAQVIKDLNTLKGITSAIP